MTIIIATENEIVSDSMMCEGDTILFPEYKKLFEDVRGNVFGFCGDHHLIKPMMDWFRDQVPDKFPKTDRDKDFCQMIVWDGHSYQEISSPRPNLSVIHPPYCMGSGRDFAMGALVAGATATQAAEVAIRLDPFCGGRIISIPIKRKQ